MTDKAAKVFRAMARIIPKSQRCLANSGGNISSLWCSLERGHHGPHVAHHNHDLRNGPLFTWPKKSERSPSWNGKADSDD